MLQYFLLLNLKLLLPLILYGYIIGILRRHTWNNFSKKSKSFFFLDLFNLVGTPVHELSHLLFALLFGFHIDKICLYRTTRTAMKNKGILGYIKIRHKEKTFFQRMQKKTGLFFIGIAPLLLSPLLLLLLWSVLPGSISELPAAFHAGSDSFLKALQQIQGTDIILLIIYLYVIIGVSMNMELSKQDLHMAGQGILMLEVLCFIILAISMALGFQPALFIDLLFRWNLMIALIGTFCSLSAHLISLILI